jgi:hypothetical protein
MCARADVVAISHALFLDIPSWSSPSIFSISISTAATASSSSLHT